MILKDTRKDFALLVSIMTGILIFTIVAGQLSRSLAAMIRILDGFQIDFVYLDVLFKIIAVSYIAKFAAQVCQDAGEGSVAVKVELAAKKMCIRDSPSPVSIAPIILYKSSAMPKQSKPQPMLALVAGTFTYIMEFLLIFQYTQPLGDLLNRRKLFFDLPERHAFRDESKILLVRTVVDNVRVLSK